MKTVTIYFGRHILKLSADSGLDNHFKIRDKFVKIENSEIELDGIKKYAEQIIIPWSSIAYIEILSSGWKEVRIDEDEKAHSKTDRRRAEAVR